MARAAYLTLLRKIKELHRKVPGWLGIYRLVDWKYWFMVKQSIYRKMKVPIADMAPQAGVTPFWA